MKTLRSTFSQLIFSKKQPERQFLLLFSCYPNQSIVASPLSLEFFFRFGRDVSRKDMTHFLNLDGIRHFQYHNGNSRLARQKCELFGYTVISRQFGGRSTEIVRCIFRFPEYGKSGTRRETNNSVSSSRTCWRLLTSGYQYIG